MQFEALEWEELSWFNSSDAAYLLGPIGQTFSLQRGQVVAVIGPAGSGKTALLHLLAGNNLVSKGEGVKVTGRINIVYKEAEHWNSLQREGRCCQCWFTSMSRLVKHVDLLYEWLSVEEVFNYEDRLTFTKSINHTSLLEHLKLSRQRTNLIHNFNHHFDINTRGNLKKSGVGRAMIGRPNVLLIDEGAGSIDPQKIVDIVRVVRDYVDEQVETEETVEAEAVEADAVEADAVEADAVEAVESEADSNCNRKRIRRCSKHEGIRGRCALMAFNASILLLPDSDNFGKREHFVLDYFDQVILLTDRKGVLFAGKLEDAIGTLGMGSLQGLYRVLDNFQLDIPFIQEAEIKGSILVSDKAGSRSRIMNLKYLPREILILTSLQARLYKNNPRPILLLLMSRLLLFTLLSLIFQNPPTRTSILGIFFYLPINQTSLVLLGTAVEAVGVEELEGVREARGRGVYGSSSFVMAKFLVLGPVNLVPALIYLPAVYFISALNDTNDVVYSFWMFYLASLLHILTTLSLGLLLAVSSTSPLIKDLYIFTVSTLIITFSGIHRAANYNLTWILRWIQFLSPTFYLFSIMVQITFTKGEIVEDLNLGVFVLGVGGSIAAMAGLGFAYLLGALLVAHFTTKPQLFIF